MAPEGLRLNSVVALPEGGFAATSTSTGDVWEWNAAAGWAVIPGTDDTTPNGLEISPDGAWLYVAGWRGEKLTRLSRGRTPRQRDVVPIGFRPDNLRFVDGGTQHPRRRPRQLRHAGGDLERRRHRPADAGGAPHLPAPADRGVRRLHRGHPHRRRDLARDQPRPDDRLVPGAGVGVGNTLRGAPSGGSGRPQRRPELTFVDVLREPVREPFACVSKEQYGW